jgi:REP element-mobilizing transposase RayT
VHVTKRIRPEVGRLRKRRLQAVLRRAFAAGCERPGFRICQFSIQGNHIHLICEADSAEALARGIQGWSVRVARGLNRVLGRRGPVFADRYHAEIITTPSQTRATLCYVLHNGRRHGERLDRRLRGADAYSSAWWFDGWRDDGWRAGLPPPPEKTVADARSWLLAKGWRRRGLIAVDEVPAAARPLTPAARAIPGRAARRWRGRRSGR